MASVFLDTPLYNGHSTAADLLWAGVPAAVLPGDGRTSPGLLLLYYYYRPVV